MSVNQPFGSNPFDGPGPPTGFAQPPHVPSPGYRQEVSTLATLSVVFAFAFAPAGAILGHLGLRQIATSGQRGRERALIGITLSYALIVATIVALVVWAAVGVNDTGRQSTAAAPSRSAGTASPSTVTPTTTTPPPPTVAPADLVGLLPTIEEVKSVPGVPDNTEVVGDGQLLIDRTTDDNGRVNITPAQCFSIFFVADTHSYDASAVRGIRINGYHPKPYGLESIESVAAYDDKVAARAGLDKILADWRSCGGSTFSYTDSEGGARVATWTVGMPANSGSGITTINAKATRQMTGQVFHSIAAKANVVVDVTVQTRPGPDVASIAVAVAVANVILNKIPGPR